MTLAPNPKKHLSHLPVDCEHGGLGEPQSPGPNQADTSTPSAFVLGLAVDIFFKKQKLLPIIHQLGQLCCLINPLRSSHQNYKTCAGHLSPGVSPNLGGIVLESTAAMKQKPVTPPPLPASFLGLSPSRAGHGSQVHRPPAAAGVRLQSTLQNRHGHHTNFKILWQHPKIVKRYERGIYLCVF